MTGRRDERGETLMYVLGMFLVVMLFLALLTDATGTQVIGASQNANHAQAVAAAEAGFNMFFDHLETDPNYLNPTTTTTAPADSNRAVEEAVYLHDGAQLTCPTTGAVACYQIGFHLTPATVEQGLNVSPETAVVDVAAEDGCKVSAKVCGKASFQVDLRRRNYLDYLYFNNSESLPPSLYASPYTYTDTCSTTLDTSTTGGCEYPAFQGDPNATATTPHDVIDGPFHTNSPFFLVCGDPTFTGRVEYNKSGAGATPAPGCSSKVNYTYQPTPVAPIQMPTPTDVSALASIAGTSYSFNGATSIVASSGGLSITNGGTTETVPYPPTGVVFVDGATNVSGVVAEGLTIAVDGDINIPSNLTYDCTLDTTTNTFPDSCPETGLIATGNITVGWLSGQSIAVDAAIMAVTGTVYVPGYDSTSTSDISTVPTFTLHGAIVEDWHGAVGAYDQSTGAIDHGYQKLWYYDPRLAVTQPPWFLEPAASQWARVSLAGIPTGKAFVSV